MKGYRHLIRVGLAAVLTLLILLVIHVDQLIAFLKPEPASAATVLQESCPLTDAQKQKSWDSFILIAKFMAGEPRCVNCHGAVNPYADKTTHVGGKFTPGEKFEFRTDETGKSVTVSVPNFVIPGNPACAECHFVRNRRGGGDAWTIPPEAKWFVGKDPTTLCKQMKVEFAAEPKEFIRHLELDRASADFVKLAFDGTRGLTDYGKEFLKADTGRDYQAEPPKSMTHNQLVEQGEKWLDALDIGGFFGGDWPGGATSECGCVAPERGVLHFEADASYEVSSATYGTINGSAASREVVDSEWIVELAPNAAFGVSASLTATNAITLSGSAKFTGSFPGASDTFSLELNGQGSSHNPVQPADDAYGLRPTNFKGAARVTVNPAAPQQPGSLRLYDQNGKHLYAVSLGIAPIRPQFTYHLHTETHDLVTHFSDTKYDNSTLELVSTDDTTGTQISKLDQPYLFGEISLYRLKPSPVTNSVGGWIEGEYDPQKGFIEGSEDFQSQQCEEVWWLDPVAMANLIGNFSSVTNTHGVPMTVSGQGATCKIHYSVKWHIPLPKK